MTDYDYWQQYEAEKKKLRKDLTSEEYYRAIKEIADRLGI